MAADKTITVRIAQRRDYQFDNHFGDALPPLRTDEPPPLGQGEGPDPLQLLAAAVANCLAASLLFALRKYRQASEPVAAEVEAQIGRNAEGRLRVQSMAARLTLGVPAEGLQHLDRVLASFESYCTVTQSVREAIPVRIEVFDARGARLR